MCIIIYYSNAIHLSFVFKSAVRTGEVKKAGCRKGSVKRKKVGQSQGGQGVGYVVATGNTQLDRMGSVRSNCCKSSTSQRVVGNFLRMVIAGRIKTEGYDFAR